MHTSGIKKPLIKKIFLWPTKLGVAGDLWIINLWLATIILIPAMFPIALPVMLYALSKHWFWFRLKERMR